MPFDERLRDEPATFESVETDDSVTVTEGEATNTLHYGSDQDRPNAGDNSVAIGFGTRAPESENTAIGFQAAQNNTGARVAATGARSAQNNTGSAVTAAGFQAAESNTGTRVTATGARSAQNNTGFAVTATGFRSAQNNTGSRVAATGFRSAASNTGFAVTAAGSRSAASNTGARVTATGFRSAQNNTGARVTAAGFQAARGDGLTDPTTMGDDNIGIGKGAIRNNQASGLICIGQEAGINAQSDDQLIITDRNGNRRLEMDLTNGNLSIEGSLTQNANL